MSAIQSYIRALREAATAESLAELLMLLDYADALPVPPSIIRRTRHLRERVMARWDELERREYAQYLDAQYLDGDDEYPYL